MAGATLRHRFYEYPHEYFGYFNDFLNQNDYLATDWTVTETGVATQVISVGAGVGGVLVVTNAAADNDASFQQNDLEVFSYAAAKRLSFSARFKVLEVLQCDFVMGLQITDTSPLAVSDGIFFRKDDGDALLDFVVVKNSTETLVASVHTMVADTFVDVEFYYGGAGMFEIVVNGANVGTAVLTNAPDDENMCISFGIQNGEAVANIMSVDYISAVQER